MLLSIIEIKVEIDGHSLILGGVALVIQICYVRC